MSVREVMGMNRIIAKLYEIEETAENILDNAKRVRDDLQNEQKLEEQAYEKELKHDLENRIQRTSQELKAQTQQEIDRVTESYRQQMKMLDEKYESLEALANAIVWRMTEV